MVWDGVVHRPIPLLSPPAHHHCCPQSWLSPVPSRTGLVCELKPKHPSRCWFRLRPLKNTVHCVLWALQLVSAPLRQNVYWHDSRKSRQRLRILTVHHQNLWQSRLNWFKRLANRKSHLLDRLDIPCCLAIITRCTIKKCKLVGYKERLHAKFCRLRTKLWRN